MREKKPAQPPIALIEHQKNNNIILCRVFEAYLGGMSYCVYVIYIYNISSNDLIV